jgi:cation diffusion facilitator CzcD-associated flavoprotein CzcO
MDFDPVFDPAFDADALHAKYLEERDKRLRPEAVDQYVSVVGRFHAYAEDPWADPGFTRDPVTEDVDVVVLGGGYAGVLTAVRLLQAGVTDVRIVEKGADFGGAWYWNRYPGIRCDIESYVYMQLLEETGYVPTEKYARGAEIAGHFREIAEHFDLYSHALLQTRITGLTWSDESARWSVATDRQDTIRARFVCVGGAGLHRPKLPGIPGIEDYRGHAFHTSRWDYAYTGGDPTGNLDRLADKRIAVIGTGATAIQVVPNVARHAKHLLVVQRTPSSVDRRGNRPTDPAWAESLRPGWQRHRRDNFAKLLVGIPQEEDLVGDAWTDVARSMSLFSAAPGAGSQESQQLADYRKMEQLRARIDAEVEDPATAEALKPWYNYACKRPCFSDEYLQAFNRPNVSLLHTDGRGLDRITERGVEFAGIEHEVDCLIFATGFDSFLPIYETGEFAVVGREGRTLADEWRDGVHSLHGMYAHHFPNLFLSGNKPQAASTANAPHILEEQATHIAAIIARGVREGVRAMEVRPEAEQRWGDVVAAKRVDKEAFFAECTPGYYNFEGAKDRPSILANAYGGGPFEYIQVCADWRRTGLGADLDITYSPGISAPIPE